MRWSDVIVVSKKLFRISILIFFRLIFCHFTFALPRRYTPNMRRQRKSKLTKNRSKIYQKRNSKQFLSSMRGFLG